jgi:hypothetical protein
VLELARSMTAGTVPLEPTRPASRLTFARVLAAFGVVVVAYEAVTWGRWLAAGPEQIT